MLTRSAHVSVVRSSAASDAPASRFAEGLGTTEPRQAPRQQVENGYVAVPVMPLKFYILPFPVALGRIASGRFVSMGILPMPQRAHTGSVVENMVPRSEKHKKNAVSRDAKADVL